MYFFVLVLLLFSSTDTENGCFVYRSSHSCSYMRRVKNYIQSRKMINYAMNSSYHHRTTISVRVRVRYVVIIIFASHTISHLAYPRQIIIRFLIESIVSSCQFFLLCVILLENFCEVLFTHKNRN